MKMPWDKKEKEDLTPIERLTSYLKTTDLSKENKEIVSQEISKFDKDQNINLFNSEEQFIRYIMTILTNKNLCARDLSEVLNETHKLYNYLSTAGYSFDDFLVFLYEDGIYDRGLLAYELISVFETIENYFATMNMIMNYEAPIANFAETRRLILNLAIFTPNDVELKTMIANFLKNSSFVDDYTALVDQQIELAKKRAGIYENLSDDYLARLETIANQSIATIEKFKEQELYIKNLQHELQTMRLEADKSIKSFGKAIESADDRLSAIVDKHTGTLDSKYIDIYAQLKVDADKLATDLANTAENEAKKAAFEAVKKMERSADDLAQTKEEYKERVSTELINAERIRKTTQEEVKKGLEEIRGLISQLGVDGNVDLSRLKELLSSPESPSSNQTLIVPNSQSIVIPNQDLEQPIPAVISSFDESIKFKKRYDSIIERKKQMEEKGVVYNKVIDDCLYFILRDFYPYLYGPSGAGKNYFVKQLAELFSIPYINVGYINEEFDIVGGRTAFGSYAPSNFYSCWRNGYIAFANELDNGIPQATVKLGDFLDSKAGEEYSFPGLGFSKRHPNCRIIAAGNTTGMGATRAHNARQKFDESIQQRFKFIKFDFDNVVEKEILKNHKEWYEFAILFRAALDNYWKFQEEEVQGQITTRDFRDIVIELEDGILKDEDILTYEFIETKDTNCLNNVAKYMKENDNEISSNAKKLIKKFSEMVEGKVS